ncbi:MAG: hypothetical protein JHD35_25040 [Sphingopyxis sp.]|nr:hypothetical protein [Sphingopyxis sp.]
MTRIGQYHRYTFEFALIAAVALITVLGFWDIYVGPKANAQPHHHLHIATAFMWMGLVLIQLLFIAGGNREMHRRIGLAILVAGPLLVGTTAALSVFSAYKGVVSGEGDFLIIQNVMITVELGLLIFLAFLLKRSRKLHASLLMSTTILFMGVALFFALISFVPQFKIEGPETFYRFQTAATTGQAICFVVGLLFFLRDRRNGWPFLFAAACFPANEAIRSLLARFDLIDPLTRIVGSANQSLTFIATFALLFSLLAVTVLPTGRQPQPA